MRLLLQLSLLTLVLVLRVCSASSPVLGVTFDQGPVLPGRYGFSGMCGGVSNGVVIAAGGCNFPADSPDRWTIDKVWYDDIYIVESYTDEHAMWMDAGHLSIGATGYAGHVSHPQHGVLCIGGAQPDPQDPNNYLHIRQSLQLVWNEKTAMVVQRPLPDLPEARAFVTAVVSGKLLYVVGGAKTEAHGDVSGAFWVLDLNMWSRRVGVKWTALPDHPQPRQKAVGALVGAYIVTFGGSNYIDGPPYHNFLDTVHAYSPRTRQWIEWPKMPRTAGAGPSPAPVILRSRSDSTTPSSIVMVFGGNNCEYCLNTTIHDHHPGFNNRIMLFDATRHEWIPNEEADLHQPKHCSGDPALHPTSCQWPATTATAVRYHKDYLVIGGEIRPRVRTTHMLIAHVGKDAYSERPERDTMHPATGGAILLGIVAAAGGVMILHARQTAGPMPEHVARSTRRSRRRHARQQRARYRALGLNDSDSDDGNSNIVPNQAMAPHDRGDGIGLLDDDATFVEMGGIRAQRTPSGGSTRSKME